jgi:serine/threonine-protein kinase
VVDVGSYHEQPFLILDYVESVSLAELMAGSNRMPVPVVVSILLDVLQGLKSAHDVVDEQGMRLGLVHGDVTPQNILVGVDGNARLTEFGSARFGSDARALEVAPLPKGKPEYLSPEQLCDAPLDGRTDLFSLGVVMWSALTGQSLFAAETHDQTVANIFRKRISPPSESGAPPGLDEILVRALSRSPEGRYASAHEMAEALARAAAAAAVAGSSVDVGRWVRREFADAVLERRRRIQAVFGGPPVIGLGATPPSSPAGPPAPSTSLVASEPTSPVRPFEESLTVESAPRAPAPVREAPPRRAPARRNPPASITEKMTRRAGGRLGLQWRVVLVSALIALPFTLVLSYLVSVPVMRHLFPPEAERAPSSQVGRLARPSDPNSPATVLAPAAPPVPVGPATPRDVNSGPGQP